MNKLMLCAIIYVGLMSLILFIMMGADKRRAVRGARRTPERRLFLVALIGGAAGGWLGMRVFHHKTRHWSFRLGFPALALLHAASLCLVWACLR